MPTTSTTKKISTSALAKKMQIPKYKLDELLLACKYIEKSDSGYTLTPLGKEKSGSMKTSPKYGEYIVWDENIEIPNQQKTSNKKYYSATKIGEKHQLSARKINMILSEIGFIEKYLKGWTITTLGTQNGGIQKENSRNGIPYVEWDESIFKNAPFNAALKEVQGNAGLEETTSIDTNTEAAEFRDKFKAEHRATDGHMVRSKAEMLIDNWLYMEGIAHAYERKLPIEEDIYCDFYIPTGKIYIEFWGLENEPKYAERKKIKKAIYEKYNFKLIELTDKEVYNLDDYLPKMLLKFGVQTH